MDVSFIFIRYVVSVLWICSMPTQLIMWQEFGWNLFWLFMCGGEWELSVSRRLMTVSSVAKQIVPDPPQLSNSLHLKFFRFYLEMVYKVCIVC